MAVSQLNAAPRPPHTPPPAAPPTASRPHPMANPGYGKRSAPAQLPRTGHDFSHLPPREAAIAAYLDRLPDGADISVKTLAKVLPYGQCALRTALNRLQREGHLRRGSECVAADDGCLHWVTRTFFSRTARDDDWWEAFARGDAPRERPRRPTRSRSFVLLAALGRTAPSLVLSQADCAALEPLVTDWLRAAPRSRRSCTPSPTASPPPSITRRPSSAGGSSTRSHPNGSPRLPRARCCAPWNAASAAPPAARRP